MEKEIAVHGGGSSITTARAWGSLAKKAGIVPAEMNEIQAAIIVQAGHEIGLQPLQSLRSMSFIKGKICMTVQLQLAMARRKGVTLKKLIEKPGECTAILERSLELIETTYTIKDAQKAGLIKEGGAYTKYEKQMLRWRAIGDGLRLIAPDLVMGLLSPEEAESIEPQAMTEAPSTEAERAVEEDMAEAIQPEEEEPPKKGKPPLQQKLEGFHKKFQFLDEMRTLKQRMGDKFYYECLAQCGYKKSSDVQDPFEMIRVYKFAKAQFDSVPTANNE